ncbi:MAG: ankyrin repeat domain-containing protein [Alphaproteobacteria bacterium]
MKVVIVVLGLVIGFVSPPALADHRCAELQEAAAAGETGQLRSLLDEGVEVDCRDPEFGGTALMEAAFWAQPEAASVLLRYGAAVNARDYDGGTALDYVDMGWFAYAFMDGEDPGVEARLEEVEELLVQAGGLLGEEF